MGHAADTAEKYIQNSGQKTSKDQGTWETTDERLLLKLYVNKIQYGMWNGFLWLKIVTNVQLL
jgi:hypothetical protein